MPGLELYAARPSLHSASFSFLTSKPDRESCAAACSCRMTVSGSTASSVGARPSRALRAASGGIAAGCKYRSFWGLSPNDRTCSFVRNRPCRAECHVLTLMVRDSGDRAAALAKGLRPSVEYGRPAARHDSKQAELQDVPAEVQKSAAFDEKMHAVSLASIDPDLPAEINAAAAAAERSTLCRSAAKEETGKRVFTCLSWTRHERSVGS
ncbi:hypothetical protein EV132_12453 [Rhizobium sullae]|uniref:Uncharacterized protein n=1 Tax=Rhizobium sullae TaxID=50338 RepID=A0A4R3PUQ1_RHISU|nr:hypothetical protein EV132_12453 [Rhizobium sullae]